MIKIDGLVLIAALIKLSCTSPVGRCYNQSVG